MWQSHRGLHPCLSTEYGKIYSLIMEWETLSWKLKQESEVGEHILRRDLKQV
jgi:hypothetical protein